MSLSKSTKNLEKLVKSVRKSKISGIIVLLILLVFTTLPIILSDDVSLYSYFNRLFFDDTDNTIAYINEYKIENVEDHLPDFAFVSARTDNDELVWTKSRRITREDGNSHDHKIHVLIESSHLKENKCILIGMGATPQEKEAYDDVWNDYIVLFNSSLEQDATNDEAIILQPKKKAMEVVFHAVNEKRKFRGVLGSSCSDADPDKSAFAVSRHKVEKIYPLVNEANAETPEFSTESSTEKDNSNVEGWAYVGIVFDNKWIEKYFEIDTSESRKNPSERELVYSFPEGTEIIATGMVNFREGHIQYIDGKWINKQAIGTICKGQAINLHALKRVALLEENGDRFEGAENDGFWWAMVSGNINRNCNP
ncbi:MAG: hypothetical protein OXF20_10710 [Gammaproteobacteria bacterium]|nr:hypothetical protein [Gammaproteobacteria bacterium]